MKFLELFEPVVKGDFGLTDEAIYKSIQHGGEFVPIWGGNKEHRTIDRLVSIFGKTKSNKPITIFVGEGIILSLDGSSGCMTYKPAGQKFALNHHAGFLKIKNDAQQKIDLEFFSIFYQKQLQELSISEGSKTLTLEQLYDAEFEIPDYDSQKEIMKKIKPLIELKIKFDDQINQKIDDLFEKRIVSNQS